jgi:hypothetical protein
MISKSRASGRLKTAQHDMLPTDQLPKFIISFDP